MKKLIYLLSSLAIVSCGQRVHEGVVIDKFFEPEEYYQSTTLIPMGKLFVPMAHLDFDDADWVLLVEGKNGKQQRFYLNEREWKTFKKGDAFKDTVICTVEDDRN